MHRHTPKMIAIDPRGLAIRSVDYYRAGPGDLAEARVDYTTHDPAGRAIMLCDPRLFQDASAPSNLVTIHALSGTSLCTLSVDAGLRVSLFGEAGQPVRSWDGRGAQCWMHYDNQLRLTALFEQTVEGEAVCAERLTYAANDPVSADHNQCGQLISHADLAGVLQFNDYGLTGTLLEQERRLEDIAQSFSMHSRFNPAGDLLSRTDAQGNEQRFSQTVDGQLRAVDLRLSHTTQRLPMVSAITYNAHGQVEREVAGNGVITTLEYAAEDVRLKRLLSRLGQNEPLQDLRYTFDPVGNVLSIEDAALPVRYFANQRIEPVNRYRYDTLYRLIEATGWEAGSVKHGPTSTVTTDPAMPGNYRQTYRYDAGNNLLELTHVGSQNHGHRLVADTHSNCCLPVHDGIEPGKDDFRKSFDANGNLLILQPGQTLRWDGRNQLCKVHPVERDGAENDSERYVYGADGLRVRKVRSLQTNAKTNIIETLYLPGLEIRTHSGTGEVLHVIDVATGRGSVRVLHWEAKKSKEISNNQQRYSLTDHLGSSTLELDQHTHLITQERFYPFGGTAWWNGETVQVSYKTVRYSGKEQDATGFYYYGVRYYISWFQRWLSPDPAGAIDGVNLFRFAQNSPLRWVDEDGRESKKFRGEANDRVEKQLAEQDPELKVIARGMVAFGAQGERQKKITQKIRHAQNLSSEILESAIVAISTQPINRLNKTFIKALLGASEVSDSLVSLIRQGLSKILNSVQSRLEEGNDQLVLFESKSSTSRGFVVLTDEHRRIFLNKRDVENSDLSALASLFIHEDSHTRLKTRDLYYTLSANLGFPKSDKEMVTMLTPSMVASSNIAKLGDKSSYLEGNGILFNVAKIELEAREGSAPVERIILNNADIWPALAFALGGHQVTSKYAHTNGC